ncbi:MAG TPA: DUF1775 domain-containing protein [Candidatus Saccharimonadales bacterium]|nr:DUF1775 domain-containing protein [Candidatus Saccharimonadales bacterium]
MKTKKIVTAAATSLTLLFLTTQTVFAHVAVTPSEVKVADFQTFSVSVPNEKDVAVTGVRLTIPSGLKEVTPTVKSGWTIETKKSGDSVTEISWTAGSIAPERRDDFSFSAQAPEKETTLSWKAYQTYADGTIVSWNLAEGAEEKEGVSGPASETKVVNDLSNSNTNSSSNSQLTQWVAYGALLLSAVSLALALRKKA